VRQPDLMSLSMLRNRVENAIAIMNLAKRQTVVHLGRQSRLCVVTAVCGAFFCALVIQQPQHWSHRLLGCAWATPAAFHRHARTPMGMPHPFIHMNVGQIASVHATGDIPRQVHLGNFSRSASFSSSNLGLFSACSLVALAAASSGKRKRRRNAPVGRSRSAPAVEEKAENAVRAGGQKLSSIAAEAALGLNVTDEDVMRRKQARRKRLTKLKKEEEEDPIRNLIDLGDDPDFFGFPYLWVQIAHLVLFLTAIAVAIFASPDIEFALLALDGQVLETLRTCLTITLTMNIFIAGWMVYEELQVGSDRVLSAIGWGLKGLIVGGVASWQRWGRLNKISKRKRVGGAA